MISIVLVEPMTAGNIGAIARVMMNFDVKELVLVNPKCPPLDREAIDRASHAIAILKKAKKMTFKSLKKRFDFVVATTSKVVFPDELSKKITKLSKKTKIALVFGRESIGLTNDEITQCDFSVTIPTSEKYATMNLSHSVAIILYEIFRAEDNYNHIRKTPADSTDMYHMNKMFKDILDKINFETKERKRTQTLVWKRIFGKAMMTQREAFAVMGLLKKISKKLK